MTIAPEVLAARVVDVMITGPKRLPADASVATARAELADEHLHLLLLVRDGVLLGTIGRGDVPADAGGGALTHASLEGRVVGPDEPMAEVHPRLVASGQRRLAVTDGAGRLLGLLCLKRDGSGYCTDAGVAARAGDPRVPGVSVC